MTPARFMEEISRWMDENHYNKVDENVMVQVRA